MPIAAIRSLRGRLILSFDCFFEKSRLFGKLLRVVSGCVSRYLSFLYSALGVRNLSYEERNIKTAKSSDGSIYYSNFFAFFFKYLKLLYMFKIQIQYCYIVQY